MKKLILNVIFLIGVLNAQSQSVKIEGYAYEEGNRGFLNEVYVKIYTQVANQMVAEVVSDREGHFLAEVPAGENYILVCKKDLFFEKTMEANATDKKEGDKIFIKLEMKREPGYLFDITIAPERDNEDVVVDGIVGAKIEIYNNTKDEEALAIESHPSMNFQYTFKKGNWYTTLIRKEGYFTKRLEAHVDIDGCILCFEGIGDLRPAVQDNLTEGNEMGSLLANIEMRKIEMDKPIPLENIYYDYNKATLRDDALQELEKLINILRDNPQLIVEIGSHTDSRGDAPFNLRLSQSRAQTVVDYLEITGNIDPMRIKPRGYGETKLVNKCSSFVECPEEEHAKNRRTELKVIGFLDVDPLKNKSLADIKDEERVQKLFREIQSDGVIEIPADGALPEEIQKDLDRQAAEKAKSQEGNSVLTSQDTEETKKPVEVGNVASELPNEVDESFKEVGLKDGEVGKDASTEKAQDKEMKVAGKKENSEEKNVAVEEVGKIFPPISESGGRGKNVREIVNIADETGYMVQILHSNAEIDINHPVLGDYQKVFMEQRTNGGYSYLLGIFPTKEEARSSIETTLSKPFPDSFIVHFENGKRVK